MTPPGSWTTVYGVIAIGVLILLVACFNFMNLATARAMLGRAKSPCARRWAPTAASSSSSSWARRC